MHYTDREKIDKIISKFIVYVVLAVRRSWVTERIIISVLFHFILFYSCCVHAKAHTTVHTNIRTPNTFA